MAGEPARMVIDVHAHYWSDAYLDLLGGDTATQRGLGAGGGADLDARLRLMDRAGVDVQVLSAAPQLPRTAEAARFVNDEYAAVVREHPDRFRAFAALPLPDMEAALQELNRALDDLGFVGVTLTTSLLDRALTEGLEPLFDELNRRKTVLYLHPAGNSACSPLIRDYNLTWMVGAPFEDTTAILQLIQAGYLLRFPDIKIISSHLGGALPMLAKRLDDHVPWEAPDIAELPSKQLRRLWYDTVSHCHVPALRCAIETFGLERILLGTDFPYEDGETFVRAIDYIKMTAKTPEEVLAILEHNAAALFNLDGPSARDL